MLQASNRVCCARNTSGFSDAGSLQTQNPLQYVKHADESGDALLPMHCCLQAVSSDIRMALAQHPPDHLATGVICNCRARHQQGGCASQGACFL